jgi:hypothetical protein
LVLKLRFRTINSGNRARPADLLLLQSTRFLFKAKHYKTLNPAMPEPWNAQSR